MKVTKQAAELGKIDPGEEKKDDKEEDEESSQAVLQTKVLQGLHRG